ncbi:MAG: Jag N-terminal domain-containing protein [Anaerolineae bacterium]|nr:Jag N-terminal domain-containing protein [Anaerolineae bacterium]
MRSVETTAADIETAIELGLHQLGVSRESVIVDILEEPSRGLLGIGARQARIRLTTAAPPRLVEAAALPVQDEFPAAGMVDAEIEDEGEYEYEDADQDMGIDDDIDADESIPESLAPASEDELDDDARVGLATLEELLAKMQIEATVTVHRTMPDTDESAEEAPWMLQIRGNDLGMLIGRRGETLAALQYITRLIASRDLQRRANIVLDVESYKTRREQMLRRLAQRMAEQAIQIGRTVALEPMSPYERRIVHLELRDHEQVETQSVGEGEHRKVTIIPRR